MPLSMREYKQIAVAIDAMHGINVVGQGVMVSQHNVKAMLQRWIRDEDYHDEDIPADPPKGGA